MKYSYEGQSVPQSERKTWNETILRKLAQNPVPTKDFTQETVFRFYTGDGGLHELNRSDYEDYHAYSDAKKEVENGQFFTPPPLCDLIMSSLKLSDNDLVADLTCGMGNFFNFLPKESNGYGCEIDEKACQVAHFLYPEAHIVHQDIRIYYPEVPFDYVVGNPPFHLRWWTLDGKETLSHYYYCQKAAELLKPLGIMALIVPQSFLADTFTDGGMIKEMERHFSFIGQVNLPENAFQDMGVSGFPTKLQFWQKRSTMDGWKAHAYQTEPFYTLPKQFTVKEEADYIYHQLLLPAKALLSKNGPHIFLELAQLRQSSKAFTYQTGKLLYHIRNNPATKADYQKCCEYLHRFYTQKQPSDMSYEVWCQKKLTEAKVISYLKRALQKQNAKPEKDVIALVKRNGQFVYKGYSAKARRQIPETLRTPIPVYQAVLDNESAKYAPYKRLLHRKRSEYEVQSQPFADMEENREIASWLEAFSLWDSSKVEIIRLNEIQKHDINLILQKKYALLQWEQGSGKTLAGIATALYRMEKQGVHSAWVISSAISIRNNWNVVLKNYNLPYVFVERLKDLERIKPGMFVIMTLNKVSIYQKQISKWIRRHKKNIQLIFDESDEISNPSSNRSQASLACFRRCRMKLLTTGTSIRNNVAEFTPQLEMLYNNSIHMLSTNRYIYRYSKESEEDSPAEALPNPFYGQPIPPYKRGYSLFSSSHVPQKVTVFGLEKHNQDIYNADTLNNLLAKTVITRTFEEVSGKQIKRLHQIPLHFPPEERAVYQKAMDEFNLMRDNYFASTGNYRKDSMMKLIQQIILLLRIGAAPDTVEEYEGETPVKVMTAVEMAAMWENEIVTIGVRHKAVLDSYQKAIQEYLPDRPLFVVTGSETSFSKRRALRQQLKDSGNGILLCTQQSLPSSVNFEYVNKVILPELHYNHSGMSQFYCRFIRYDSTEYKDIYFLTYAESIESNLLQMILSKEKLTLFMKGQDVDLNEVYERFNVDYDLMSMLMVQEKDDKGALHIQWGKQRIA